MEPYEQDLQSNSALLPTLFDFTISLVFLSPSPANSSCFSQWNSFSWGTWFSWEFWEFQSQFAAKTEDKMRFTWKVHLVITGTDWQCFAQGFQGVGFEFCAGLFCQPPGLRDWVSHVWGMEFLEFWRKFEQNICLLSVLGKILLGYWIYFSFETFGFSSKVTRVGKIFGNHFVKENWLEIDSIFFGKHLWKLFDR